ncbi:MAG TPA: hypothetical protein VH299_14570 [Solirubrobacterales bacterium]|nr:hypothetical protein [Solirubrobacterales bacterium]
MSFLSSVHVQIVGLIADVSVNPDPNAIPGTPALEKLLNGLAALGLLACTAAILLGAAQIGFGQRANNYSQAADGKSKLLYGLAGAFVIGASAAIVNFFFNAGSAVH